jgi:hypothetical protein
MRRLLYSGFRTRPSSLLRIDSLHDQFIGLGGIDKRAEV